MEALEKIIAGVQSRIDGEELYFCFFHGLGMDLQGEVAKQISDLSKTDDTVLDVEPEEVCRKRLIALLFEEETDRLVAFVTMMQPFENELGLRLGEVGTMFTIPEYQKQGFATFLVNKIDEELALAPDIDGAYAFLNDKSPHPFASCGYSATVDTGVFGYCGRIADILPHQAVDLCRTVCQNELLLYRDKVLAGGEPCEKMEKAIEEYFESRKNDFLERADKVNEKYFDYSKDELSEEEYRQLFEANSEWKNHLNFYHDNIENDLLCCSLVVGKIY